MDQLNYKGYRLIGSVRVWQDWTLVQDQFGLYPLEHISDDDNPDLDESDVESYTFDGGDFMRGDHQFKTLAECREFIDTIPENKEG